MSDAMLRRMFERCPARRVVKRKKKGGPGRKSRASQETSKVSAVLMTSPP